MRNAFLGKVGLIQSKKIFHLKVILKNQQGQLCPTSVLPGSVKSLVLLVLKLKSYFKKLAGEHICFPCKIWLKRT